MEINSVIKLSGLTKAEFAKEYGIPESTIYSWCRAADSKNSRSCPKYVVSLLEKLVRYNLKYNDLSIRNSKRPSELLKIKYKEIISLFKKYKNKGLSMFRLFGSVAREDDTLDSDIDFLVHVDYESKNYRPGITIKLKNDLIKLLNIDVDVVTDEALSPNFKEVIENEVKLLYA